MDIRRKTRMNSIKNKLVLEQYENGGYGVHYEGGQDMGLIQMREVLFEIKKHLSEWEHENGKDER
jgi:hypothetical protein